MFTLDAPRGLEPRFLDSNSSVLPLDDGAIFFGPDGWLRSNSTESTAQCATIITTSGLYFGEPGETRTHVVAG
jgi:hypothetical protein